MSADRFTLYINILVYVLNNQNTIKRAAAETLLRTMTERDCRPQVRCAGSIRLISDPA